MTPCGLGNLDCRRAGAGVVGRRARTTVLMTWQLVSIPDPCVLQHAFTQNIVQYFAVFFLSSVAIRFFNSSVVFVVPALEPGT